MAVFVDEQYLQGFIDPKEREYLRPFVEVAHDMLHAKKGAGNDFLGWLDLPLNYDKEEFARIKAAAEKIKAQSQVLIVIGIGGSYLGARAAIEFIGSPFYNNLKKDLKNTNTSGTIGNIYINKIVINLNIIIPLIPCLIVI